MTVGQTVIATWMLGVLEQFAALGIDVSKFSDAEWTRDALRLAPTRQLQLVTVRRLWHQAAEQSGEPLLGLRVGERLPLQAMNIIALVVMHSPTLREALAHTVRYQQLVSNSGRFRLRTVAGGLRLAYAVTPCPVAMHRTQLDSVFAGYWSLLRRCVPAGVTPMRIGLPRAAAGDAGAYRELFACPVEFNEQQAFIDFGSEALDRPVRGADSILLRLATERADTLLAQQGRSDALVEQVRAAIASAGFDRATCEGAAQAIGMGTRSLQRRLSESATNFRQLLEAARMDDALRLLAEGSLSFARISERLGFSEPSAFSHAVSSYWGASPRELRRELAVNRE
jgi:AraC-like DNA-binding protein